MSNTVKIDRAEALGRAITVMLQLQNTQLPAEVASVHVQIAQTWAIIAQGFWSDDEAWTGDISTLAPITWERR